MRGVVDHVAICSATVLPPSGDSFLQRKTPVSVPTGRIAPRPGCPQLLRCLPGYTANMTDNAGPVDEPDAGNDASGLPPHLAALVGALDGPPDLAREHDK